MIFRNYNNKDELILKCDCTTDCGNTVRFINAYGKIWIYCSSEEFYSRQRSFGFEIGTFFKWAFKKETPILFNIIISNNNVVSLRRFISELEINEHDPDFDNITNYSYLKIEKERKFGDYSLSIIPNKNFKKSWFLNKGYYRGLSLCLDKNELLEMIG